ncbi:MAG TPA: hypothetical protein VIW67_12185 [Terriglobales bacterium]
MRNSERNLADLFNTARATYLYLYVMLKLRRIVFGAAAAGVLGCAFAGAHAVGAENQSDVGAKPETVESRTITVRIDRPFENVYEFLADPANWNQWAFGLGKNIRPSKDNWIADSDGGIAKVLFTPRNDFGVVDHTVIRPSGQRVYVPMRLIVNGSGCELLFTLFREPNMSDTRFASDAGFVQRDLNGLKRLLEK